MNNPPAVLFDQFLKERTYLKNVTPKTITCYSIAYRNYRKVIPGEDLPSKASLQALVIALRERGIRPVTVNTYVAAMNAFCAWLHQERHLAVPVKAQKLRVEKRVLTLLDDTQMRALIRFRPRTFRQARTHFAACLILDTGLRISEALHLRREDVDYDNLLLKVFGKGQKERLVPFSHDLRKRLYRFAKWQGEKGIQSHPIFAGFGGASWEKRNSTTSLYLLQQTIGLPKFGWHRLRHTFATNYLRHGGDIDQRSANDAPGTRSLLTPPEGGYRQKTTKQISNRNEAGRKRAEDVGDETEGTALCRVAVTFRAFSDD